MKEITEFFKGFGKWLELKKNSTFVMIALAITLLVFEPYALIGVIIGVIIGYFITKK